MCGQSVRLMRSSFSYEISYCRLCLFKLYLAGVTQLTLSGPTVSYAGGRATFTCSNGENTVSVQWLVNTTLFSSSSMNIISEFSNITSVGNLIFRDVLQYNGTTIQCSATSSSGRITHSNNITMLVQGWLIHSPCFIIFSFLITM